MSAIALGCGLFVPAAQVRAESVLAPAEQPQWNSGDKWTYIVKNERAKTELTWSQRVISAKVGGGYDVDYRMENQPNANVGFDADTNSLDRRGAEYTWRRFYFPLTLGKRWSHERKIENKNELVSGSESSTWEVQAFERITVPAGSYDCYRVMGTAFRNERSEQRVGFSRWTTQINTTYWYCPEVKSFAKRRIETDSAGVFLNVETSELTAFEHN